MIIGGPVSAKRLANMSVVAGTLPGVWGKATSKVVIIVLNPPLTVISNDRPAVIGIIVAPWRCMLPTACWPASLQVLDGNATIRVHIAVKPGRKYGAKAASENIRRNMPPMAKARNTVI